MYDLTVPVFFPGTTECSSYVHGTHSISARESFLKVPDQPTIAKQVIALVDLPPDVISDGYDYALMLLAKLAPTILHE